MERGHVVLAVTGAILFLWFVLPFVLRGICNIGNMTGMVLAGMLFGYGVFYGQIHRGLAEISRSSAGKFCLTAAAVLAAAAVGIVVAETLGMVRAAGRKPPQNTTAVVLGCSVKGEQPSRILQERLEAAYAYLAQNPQACCVLSGGQGEGEEISEAACMYRYLTKKGIPAERLLCEEQSVNTEENLRFSKKLLEQQGMRGDITIVTSEFHAYRAAKTAERLGISSYSTPSHTFLLYLPTYYIRELYGILYYMLK